MGRDGANRPSGTSVMRVNLDAATSTSIDGQEAQWRAGVNRQAQPHARAHQVAASQAAAAKRTANAMPAYERLAKRAAARQEARKRKLDALATSTHTTLQAPIAAEREAATGEQVSDAVPTEAASSALASSADAELITIHEPANTPQLADVCDSSTAAMRKLGVAARAALFIAKLFILKDAADEEAACLEDNRDRMQHEQEFREWLADPAAQATPDLTELRVVAITECYQDHPDVGTVSRTGLVCVKVESRLKHQRRQAGTAMHEDFWWPDVEYVAASFHMLKSARGLTVEQTKETMAWCGGPQQRQAQLSCADCARRGSEARAHMAALVSPPRLRAQSAQLNLAIL